MSISHIYANLASSNIVGKREVVAEEVYQSNPQDAMIYTLIAQNGLNKTPTDATYIYEEIDQRVNRTTLNGAIASAGTTTFVMTDACFEAGQQVRVNGELITLGTTSDNLTFSTCTRSVGSVAAAAHADGDMVAGLPTPRAQGAAAGSTGSHVVMPSQVTTYTQIFRKDIVVSGTAEAISAYGNVNKIANISAQQEQALKLEVEQAFLFGKSQAPSTTSTAGRFDGLIERLTAASQTTDLANADPTITNLEYGVQTCRDYNYMPNAILCGLRATRVFNSWGLSKYMSPNSAATFGVSVPVIELAGSTLQVISTPSLDSEMVICDSSRFEFGWMPGRELALTYMGKDGDRTKAQLLGEGVAAFPNPASAYMFTSVKWSA